MEIKSTRIDSDCADFLVFAVGESCVRFDLDKEKEIKETLDNITKFLKSEYMITDNDIVISRYIKDGKFNGISYYFRNSDHAIKGQLCIAFLTDKKQPCYIFRTAIGYPPEWSISQYNELCKQIDKLVRELKLKMNTHSKSPYNMLRTSSPYSEPIFYVIQNKLDISSFKGFMGKIQTIAERYPLHNN
ncbi:Uncharacterised protein [uncultured archaeon]|nr:Uncharacterised protein [uncultured archaeon]